MGIFDFLFGKRDNAEPAPPVAESPSPAPQGTARGSTYDPGLISRLAEEHQSLLTLFGKTQEAQRAGNFTAVSKTLEEFQMALNLHLAAESAYFYAYLRRSLSIGSAEHDTMMTFWDEMQGIGKVVTVFLRKYIDADFTPELRTEFGAELEVIGGALVARIQREENTLYKLYAPR